jgi:hypothetical protein
MEAAMSRPGPSTATSSYRAALALALLLAGGSSPPAGAQQNSELPINIIATKFLEGRFQMPVTCNQTDGTQIEVHEGVVFRPAKNRDGTQMLKMTFFGIAGSDLARCYNLVHSSIPDRRGVLYLSYSSFDKRADTGIKNFVRSLERGPLEYVITGGRLQIQSVGDPEAETQVIRFDGKSTPLYVSAVAYGSDADKLLGRPPLVNGRRPRRLNFRIEGPGDFRFETAYLEDSSRMQ